MAIKVFCDITGEEIPKGQANLGKLLTLDGRAHIKGYSMQCRVYKTYDKIDNFGEDEPKDSPDIHPNVFYEFASQNDMRPKVDVISSFTDNQIKAEYAKRFNLTT